VGEVVVIGCLDHRRNPLLVKERVAGVIPFPDPS
jgi:hypothetical protein